MNVGVVINSKGGDYQTVGLGLWKVGMDCWFSLISTIGK
jgi:hypothetical protein